METIPRQRALEIVQHFPEHADALMWRIGEDADFEDLCRDYLDTRDALRGLTSGAKQDETRVAEYRCLLQELGVDLLRELARRGGANP